MASELRAVVERWYEAFNRGDFDAVTEVFAPDVETTDPSLGTTTHSVEAWRAHGEAFKRALPDARLNLHSAVESVTRSPSRVPLQAPLPGLLGAPRVKSLRRGARSMCRTLTSTL
jgi:hypothetical protein